MFFMTNKHGYNLAELEAEQFLQFDLMKRGIATGFAYFLAVMMFKYCFNCVLGLSIVLATFLFYVLLTCFFTYLPFFAAFAILVYYGLKCAEVIPGWFGYIFAFSPILISITMFVVGLTRMIMLERLKRKQVLS